MTKSKKVPKLNKSSESLNEALESFRNSFERITKDLPEESRMEEVIAIREKLNQLTRLLEHNADLCLSSDMIAKLLNKELLDRIAQNSLTPSYYHDRAISHYTRRLEKIFRAVIRKTGKRVTLKMLKDFIETGEAAQLKGIGYDTLDNLERGLKQIDRKKVL